jgi:hypothetical protein
MSQWNVQNWIGASGRFITNSLRTSPFGRRRWLSSGFAYKLQEKNMSIHTCVRDINIVYHVYITLHTHVCNPHLPKYHWQIKHMSSTIIHIIYVYINISFCSLITYDKHWCKHNINNIYIYIIIIYIYIIKYNNIYIFIYRYTYEGFPKWGCPQIIRIIRQS